MKRIVLIAACLLLTEVLPAQNPVLPPGVYIADPAGRVGPDGKLYIYGSLDESTEYYCSDRYHLLSSADLHSWQLQENIFTAASKNDGAQYANGPLYAPDMCYRNGRYYLYYCLPDGTEGVVTSKRPEGPFRNGLKITGPAQIDPAVFIDDDGQAYYYWGQFEAKGARMNPDMKTIDTTSIVEGLVTEKKHFFHEGAFVFKRKGIYYMVYSHIGRQDRPTCIGYATAHSPLGPFKYGGVIIDNAGCDPAVWNNHGSVVAFHGKWYVLYHRATHNSATMRKACIEPITFRPDGSIPEVFMTSQGAGAPLTATKKIDAERACLLFGNVRIQLMQGTSQNEALMAIRNGDRAAWKFINYGNGVRHCNIRVRARAGGRIDIIDNYPWHGPRGSITVPADGSWSTISCEVTGLAGIQALWLQFHGQPGKDLFDIDWIKFE
ncbi:family 43 glycosylhydrolase [Niabella ginsenosidivorans]|nr:family 43 glycosylhydrolase [Niabella ginsenosidivorans]